MRFGVFLSLLAQAFLAIGCAGRGQPGEIVLTQSKVDGGTRDSGGQCDGDRVLRVTNTTPINVRFYVRTAGGARSVLANAAQGSGEWVLPPGGNVAGYDIDPGFAGQGVSPGVLKRGLRYSVVCR
jgi:hypothetical protein